MVERGSNELESSVRERLHQIAAGLNGDFGSPFRLSSDVENFTASFGLFADDYDQGLGLSDSLSALLGKPIRTEQVEDCSLEDLLAGIRDSISWPGEEGSHPDWKYLRSEKFSNDLALLLADIEAMFAASSSVRSFVLMEGHPFYPVFWEFAFVFLNENRIRVLIGSSSD